MKIGIDANCLIFEKAGIGKYTENLLLNLLRLDRRNDYILYFTFLRRRREREEIIKNFLKESAGPKVSYRILPIPAQWYEFLISTHLPITTLIKDPLDVFFSPYAAGIPNKGFAKMFVTIHDLVFLRFPEHRGRRLSRYYLKRHRMAVRNVRKIIVPSRATKRDLEFFLKVPASKIKVIPEAPAERFKVVKVSESRKNKIISRYFDPKTQYILSVGTLEPRKNLSKLVEAYSLLPHFLQKEYQLVLAGGRGWNNSRLVKTINNLNLKDKVILPGFVKDNDLPYIYNKASVFVFPSLYEGFGLPPLEAMACGVPVIASNCSAMPEVLGGGAVLVNPESEDEIARAIKRIILRPKYREGLKAKGIRQAKKFSWGETARETLKILEN